MAQPMLLKQLNKIIGGLGQTGETFDTAAARTALGIGGLTMAGSNGPRNLTPGPFIQLPLFSTVDPFGFINNNSLIIPGGTMISMVLQGQFAGQPGKYLNLHLRNTGGASILSFAGDINSASFYIGEHQRFFDLSSSLTATLWTQAGSSGMSITNYGISIYILGRNWGA